MPRHLTILLLAGSLLSGAGPGSCLAGQPDPAEPETVRELFVPFEDLSVLLQDQPQRVLLSRAEYEELVRKAKKSPAEEVPYGAVLVSADYAASIQQQRALLSGTLVVDVLDDGLHEVPLEIGGVGLQSATLDGQNAAIGRRDEGRLGLLVEGIGRHKLVLEMVAPVQTTAAEQVLHFRLPRPAAAGMHLSVPGDVEVKSGAEVTARTVDETAGLTRLDLLPRRGDTTLVMTLNSRLQRGERTLVVRSVLVSEVTEAYEKLHAAVSLEILHRAMDHFRFGVPDGFEITEIRSPLLARWDVQEEDGRQVLGVWLREPTTDPVLLNLSAIRTPGRLATWQFPALVPLEQEGQVDVVGQVAVLGLLVEDRLTARGIVPKELIPINTASLSQMLPETIHQPEPGTPPLRPVVAFYAPRKTFELTAAFDKPPAKLAVRTSLLLILEDQGHQVHGGFSMVPKVEKLFEFDFSVPPFWQVTRVIGANETPLPFERFGPRDGPSRIRVRLPEGIEPGREYTANFHGRRTPPGWLDTWPPFPGRGGQQKVEFPVFAVRGADDDTGAIAIEARDDMIVRSDTQLAPLDEAEKQRYGLAEVAADLAFRYEQQPYTAALAVERTQPRLTARTFSFLRVQPDALSCHYEIIYEVEEARVRSLSLLLPEATTPETLTIRGLDDVKLKQDDSQTVDGMRRWTAQLDRARRGTIRLAVDFEQPLPAKRRKDLVLPVVAAGGEHLVYQSGLVAAEGSAELDVQLTAKGRRVDVGELVDADYQPGQRLLGVYQFVGQPDANLVQAHVSRHPGYGLYPAVVQRADLSTHLAADGTRQTRAEFALRTKALYLEVVLPADAELWSARLDDKPVKPQRDGTRLLVSLPAGRSDALRVLRIVFSSRGRGVGLSGKLSMEAPRLLLRSDAKASKVEVPLCDVRWKLHVPSGYEVTRAGGTVVTDQLAEYEPAAVTLARDLWRWSGGDVEPFYGGLMAARSAARHSVQEAYLARQTGIAVDTSASMHEIVADLRGAAPPTPAEAKIAAALKSPTELEFIETPLQDVVEYLKNRHEIEIQIDTRALDDVGIGTDTPITKNLKSISLRSALRLMLRELDLTYCIQDEVLLITTPEEAESRLTTKVYPVSDLVLPPGESGAAGADFDSLIELITSTVQPTTWDEVGGPGGISHSDSNNNPVLVLAQTDDVHEEIAQLLANMRKAREASRGDGRPPLDEYRVIDLARTPEDKKILDALQSPTEMSFTEAPLSDVVDYLRERHKVEIQIDTKGLDDVGIGSDTPITKDLKGTSLQSAMRLVLRDLDLTCNVEDGVLLITTPEEAETRLVTRVYPVEDLVMFRNKKGQHRTDFKSLIETITSTVYPTTWDDVGGPGSIGCHESNRCLVVSQTQEIHDEIAKVLKRIRNSARARRGQPWPPLKDMPDRSRGGVGGAGMGGMGLGGGMGGAFRTGEGRTGAVPPGHRPAPAPPGSTTVAQVPRDEFEAAATDIEMPDVDAPLGAKRLPPRELKGVRSLDVDPDREAAGTGIEITFRSLGFDPRLEVTLANRSRLAALGWGSAMALGLFGLAITNRRLRTKVWLIVVAALVATVVPLVYDCFSAVYICNLLFYAAVLLVPYYLAVALAKWAWRASRRLLQRLGLFAAASAAMVLAGWMVPAADAAEPKEKAGPYVIQIVEPSEPVKVPDDAVILPYDPAAEGEIQDADRLLVPYARYVELWNRAHPDRKIETRKPPLEYAPAGASYQATLKGDEYLLVTGQLAIDVYVDGYVTVPLRLSGGVLARAELDGQPARLSTAGIAPKQGAENANNPPPQAANAAPNQNAAKRPAPDGSLIVLYVSGKGRHQLELAVRLKLSRRGGWRVAEGLLPAAPASALSLVVPQGGTELRLARVADRAGYETEQEDEKIETALGADGAVSIQWRPKVAEGQIDRDLTAQSRAVFDVREDGLRMVWQLVLKFPRGQRQEFRVRLPDGYLVEKVAGTNVRGWETIDDGGRPAVDVTLLNAAKEQETMTIHLWRSGAVGQDELAGFGVPQIDVPAAVLHEGQLTIRRSRMLELRTLDVQGLTRTDLGSWAAELAGSGDKESTLGIDAYQAYRFMRTPFAAELSAAPVRAKASAEVFTVLKVLEHEQSFQSRVTLDVQGGPIHRVEIIVPGELDVQRVTAPGGSEWALTERDGRRLLTVYLAAGQAGKVPILVRGILGRQATVQRIALPRIEVLGVQSQKGDFAVQVDRAYDVRAEDLENCAKVLPHKLQAWLNPRQQAVTRLPLHYTGSDYQGTLHLTRRSADVSCTTISNVKVTDQTVEETIWLDFEIRHAGIDRVAFLLPAEMADSRLEVPMLRQKTITPLAEGSSPFSEGGVRVELQLQDEVMDQLRVLLKNDRLLKPGRMQRVPIPTVETGRTDRRFVVLESASQAEVLVEVSAELKSLGRHQEEWQTLRSVLGGGMTRAYLVNTGAEKPRLEFRTKEREVVETAGASIGLAETHLVLDNNGAYRAEVTYKLDNTTEQFLQVELPPAATLWTARVAGKPVKPVQVPAKTGVGAVNPLRVDVPLVKTAPGAPDYEVVLYYGGRMPALGAGGSISFPLMHTQNINVELSRVDLYVPKTHHWFDFDGTMRMLTEEGDVEVGQGIYWAGQAKRTMKVFREGDAYAKVRAAPNLKQQIAKVQQWQSSTRQYVANAEVQFLQEANTALLREAQEVLDKTELVPQAPEYGNRDRLSVLFDDQKNTRTRNWVRDAGDNWSEAAEATKAAPAAAGSTFNKAWLDQNQLYNPVLADEKDKGDAAKQPSSGKPRSAWGSWKGKKPPSSSQPQPQAPQVAQGQAKAKLAESFVRQQTEEGEARKGQRDRDREKIVRYHEKQQQLQSESPPQEFDQRIAPQGAGEQPADSGIVTSDDVAFSPNGDRAVIADGTVESLHDGVEGQAAGGGETGRPATPEATGLAGLRLELPERDDFYEVYRFTTPRGEVKIAARTVSRKLSANLGRLAVLLAVVAAVGCLVRMALHGRFDWLVRPRGAVTLICLGLLSVVCALLPRAGLLLLIAGIAILAWCLIGKSGQTSPKDPIAG